MTSVAVQTYGARSDMNFMRLVVMAVYAKFSTINMRINFLRIEMA